ncbi:MAG TPA: PBP1A family penicillin-binding protein, partial [Bryobacteraceae bacterium]|nr:PBP1A family penicillin-binding protein [Bryobacteraceae bacterium]
ADAATGRVLPNYQIKPQLLSDISQSERAKRMPVQFTNLPPVLVNAILAAEDKRFFHHSGIDTLRLAKAAYVDLRDRRKQQGASTITMQLARNLCLRRAKSWKRKLEETLIAIHLEHKLSKDQIFQRYCNLVYLGGDASFGIIGVGEAAEAYFGKDVRDLSVPEAATIAGLIQRPVYLNPFRYPSRAVDRRNLVLSRMLGDRYLSTAQYEAAIAAPLGLHPDASGHSESQYFVDAASKQAVRDSGDVDQPTAVYTTLDLRLQQAAEHAIADGMQLVDKQLAARHKSLTHRPQVALIAIDPHTGEVKALCGGRDYAASQLDRVFAKRPPGSVFKPFVYTAAMNTAITGGEPVLTPASMVDDSPTTFDAGNDTYSPSNFKHEFMGEVTLRQALAHSLNVATVKVGEMVGFQNVVAVAREAGMNGDIQPTPAVALGAYQVTPYEIARAYTIFANGGSLVQPVFIESVRDADGGVSHPHATPSRRVLDPRVAFLMVDMLQEVMRSGTAAGVRARGFRLPAAGKTGTSHDGWFAGFTSQLLTVVWVGYDDYTDLGLEGARSALPIWTEFMSEAARYRQYAGAKPFAPPEGVTQVAVDPVSGQLAGPGCGPGVSSYFIDGTQPQTPCTPQEVQVISTPDGGVVEQIHAAGTTAIAQPVSNVPVPPITDSGTPSR